MKPTATLVTPTTVRMERLLPGPVERVWSYITDGTKRATWFCGGEFDLRVGGRVQLVFDNNSLSADKSPPEKYRGSASFTAGGVITRLEPMRLLAHTWTWDAGDTEITYELTPRGDEVLLTIVHTLVGGDRATLLSVMSGWDTHTGILADVLGGVEPRPFWQTHGAREKDYGALV